MVCNLESIEFNGNNKVEKWYREVLEQIIEAYHPRHKKKISDLLRRKSEKTLVWLGGPGTPEKDCISCPVVSTKDKIKCKNGKKISCQDYLIRLIIRKVLEKLGLDVMFSEEYRVKTLEVSFKELNEVDESDIIIILAITPGASGEAIEFAYYRHLHEKLFIFIPTEYKDGYIYRSLSTHRLITEENEFDLNKVRNSDPELAVKVVSKIINYIMHQFRKKRMRKCFKGEYP